MTIEVINPRTGKVDYSFTPLTPQEIDGISSSLKEAQKEWWNGGVESRISALLQFADAIQKHRTEIEAALINDTGRTAMSRMELDGLCGYIGARCEQARELFLGPNGLDRAEFSKGEVIFKPQHTPYPLVSVISPWNYPLILSFLDAVPALLAGCSTIIKPSEVTPRFIEPVTKAMQNVPALEKVVKLVAGDGATGQSIIERSDAVVFTGSTSTGRKVGDTASKNVIPAMLELGGKDPAIVLSSADISSSAHSVLRGAIVNNGQACFSTERIYVASEIYDEFLTTITDLANKVVLDFPDPENGHIGPFIFQKQAEIAQNHIDDAVSKGAVIVSGGKVENHGGGLWLRPTILTDVNHSMDVMRDETFAPILPIVRFDDIESAIELANDTTYGLSAAVFGELEEATKVGERLDAGGIFINDVDLVGEVGMSAEKHAFKNSGSGGSRYGPEGMMRYLRKKAIVARTNQADPLDALLG